MKNNTLEAKFAGRKPGQPVAVYEHSNRGDFRYVREELYMRQNGEFSLACEGGPMSKYATHCGKELAYGNKIIKLTDSEANAWAESRGIETKKIKAAK